MFSPYADRRPDPDAPIDVRTYGLMEWVSDEELEELARACGILLGDPEDQVGEEEEEGD